MSLADVAILCSVLLVWIFLAIGSVIQGCFFFRSRKDRSISAFLLWGEKKEGQFWGAECPSLCWSQQWQCLPCAHRMCQKAISFQHRKGRSWAQAVFLIVFIQPSLVSEDRVQEQGTAQSASRLADVCTRLPLWLIPNTSRSFRRVIFYFHFGALLLLLLLCPLLPDLKRPVSCCLSDGSNVRAWFLFLCRYGFFFRSKGCFSCHFYSPVSSILHHLWLGQSVYMVFFRGVFVLNECLLGSPM